tara:strand:- start:654 stop:2306 length:1653 start_codon:yes stop_codon:yes gene_type:complete
MTSTTTDRINGARSSLAIKSPCVAATTAAITLNGTQTIDGVAVVTGDRVLVKNQTSGVDNGIYVADTGDWVRAPDSDGNQDLTYGTIVKVNGGTVGQGFWYCSTTGTITVGTTSISFGAASSTLAVISAYAQTLLDDADAATARATLGVSYGVGVREILTAARSYYVRTDGSNSNTGLADTAGGAFLTIQKAIDVVHETLDLNGKTVTINVGAGTYTAGITVTGPFVGGGGAVGSMAGSGRGTVILSGQPTSIISVTGTAILVEYGATLQVANFDLRATVIAMQASHGGRILFSGTIFGAQNAGGIHMYATRGGDIEVAAGAYYIAGAGGDNHVHCSHQGQVRFNGSTVTLNANVTFNSGVYYCLAGSDITFTNSANVTYGAFTCTGQKFKVTENAIIQWIGGSWDSPLGNSSGIEYSNGRYVSSLTETSNYIGSFTFDMSTASGTTTITGMPWRPSGVELLASQTGVAGKMSMGFDDTTNRGEVIDGQNVTAANWFNSTAASINIYEAVGAYVSAVVSSTTSDGFVVTRTKTGAPAAGTVTVIYRAWRG